MAEVQLLYQQSILCPIGIWFACPFEILHVLPLMSLDMNLLKQKTPKYEAIRGMHGLDII